MPKLAWAARTTTDDNFFLRKAGLGLSPLAGSCTVQLYPVAPWLEVVDLTVYGRRPDYKPPTKTVHEEGVILFLKI